MKYYTIFDFCKNTENIKGFVYFFTIIYNFIIIMNNKINIYVINLDKDEERLTKIKKALSPNTFTRVPAIYGNQDDLTIFDNVIITSRVLTPKSVLATGLSHKKAIEMYLVDAKNDTDTDTIGLILEDDATPITDDYMKKVNIAIQNAPTDWEIIKLDYLPTTPMGMYSKIPTTLLTAYLINRKGAEKYVKTPIYYHVDLDVWFKNIVIYNNPYRIFQQEWNNNNGSNNQLYNTYNPFSKNFYILNYKALRFLENEYTIADLLLFLIVCLVVTIWFYFYGIRVLRKCSAFLDSQPRL